MPYEAITLGIEQADPDQVLSIAKTAGQTIEPLKYDVGALNEVAEHYDSKAVTRVAGRAINSTFGVNSTQISGAIGDIADHYVQFG